MSEEPKKSRRRRRRPRSSSRNKSNASAKASQKASSKASSGEGKSGSTGGRRGRSRRRSSGGNRAKARDAQGGLTIQQHTEKSISAINKDIFIYTYTLRPRSLLDSYQAGPNIAEKMKFEQPDKPPLDN